MFAFQTQGGTLKMCTLKFVPFSNFENSRDFGLILCHIQGLGYALA